MKYSLCCYSSIEVHISLVIKEYILLVIFLQPIFFEIMIPNSINSPKLVLFHCVTIFSLKIIYSTKHGQWKLILIKPHQMLIKKRLLLVLYCQMG